LNGAPEVQFYAFDCLVSDGQDLRKLPLTCARQTCQLLARASMASSRATSGVISPAVGAHRDVVAQR
jgi:ATP-dependent DNA ligase